MMLSCPRKLADLLIARNSKRYSVYLDALIVLDGRDAAWTAHDRQRVVQRRVQPPGVRGVDCFQRQEERVDVYLEATAHRRPARIRSNLKSSSPSKLCRLTTRLLSPKKRSRNGKPASASATWNAPISLRFRPLNERALPL